MDLVSQYWEVLVALFLGVVTAVKLKQETQELRKDVDDINRRDTYTEVVKLRAEMDTVTRNIASLWDQINRLNDKK
ncbi:MAG: hypothetical protein CMO16_02935 [Thaumarchaeota archaeon]|nr:hypothetical protein [Nitrososphaerota archaeon]